MIALVVVAIAVALTPLQWSEQTWVVVLGALTLAGLGLIDDVATIDARLRLVAQLTIGGLVGVMLAGWIGLIVGAIVMTAAVNMVNFMDGINGIAAGHGVVGGAGALAAGALLDSQPLVITGAISLGGAVGFLPWNLPKAHMFLGDVGSYLFGALAGVSVLLALMAVGRTGGQTSWEALALVCAPYLIFALDTATTIFRRARRGENLLEAHRDHVYQRLVHRAQFSHAQVTSGAVFLSASVTLAAWFTWVAGAVVAVLAALAYLSSPRLAREEVTI